MRAKYYGELAVQRGWYSPRSKLGGSFLSSFVGSHLARLPARLMLKNFPDVSPATRKVMQANKGKDTKPEMTVRRLVHGLGYRYRLHRKALPGRPDLVFGPHMKVIFVHGCFWHGHGCFVAGKPVVTRSQFWECKFAKNKERDARVMRSLQTLGWQTLVIWECETRDKIGLETLIHAFLSG